MVWPGKIETGSRCNEDMFPLEQFQREPAVIETGQLLGVNAREGVHGAVRFNQIEIAACGTGIYYRLAGCVKATIIADQFLDALVAAKRGLDGPLSGDVAAQAKRGEQLDCVNVVGRAFLFATERNPSDAVATGSIDFG